VYFVYDFILNKINKSVVVYLVNKVSECLWHRILTAGGGSAGHRPESYKSGTLLSLQATKVDLLY